MAWRSIISISLACCATAALAQWPAPRAVADSIVAGANAFREENGLHPLQGDPELEQAAGDFAAFMAKTRKYGHHADGRTPAQRASAAGYDYCIVAENLAFHYRSDGYASAEALARELLEGWKHSPGHRRNLLDGAVTETGVGVARGPDERYYAVQVFGRPQSAATRFELANRSGAAVSYTVDEREYALKPRTVRSHTVCRPVQLRVSRQGQEIFEGAVSDRTRYAIEDNGVSLRRP